MLCLADANVLFMYCECNTFSARRNRSLKRLHVVDHISAANRKVCLAQKNYFPREGEKFLSRGSKNIPVIYPPDILRIPHR